MKTCKVRYTSASRTPCFRTLSRSTLMNSWGTLGRWVVFSPASSGRFLAASMYRSRFWVRNPTSCLPERSSRMNVNPAVVPTPGIDGGENAKALACGSFASSRLMCARMAGYFSSALVRSLHGLSVTKKKAL